MAHIEKRADSYRIKVSCGFDGSGKRIFKSKTWVPSPGMSENQIKKELHRQAIMFEEECQKGLVLNPSMTFAEFVKLWREKYAVPELKEKTVQAYDNMLKRTLPALGHLKLDRIQPTHLLDFYEQLRGEEEKKAGLTPSFDFSGFLSDSGMSKAAFARAAGIGEATARALISGKNVSAETAEKIASYMCRPVSDLFTAEERHLSEKSVLNYHRLISSILKIAVQWQVIVSSPAERVKAPRVKKKEISFLDEEQVIYMLDCLKEEETEFQAIVQLLLFSGMRRGELLGLEWPDIDFENNRIRIKRNRVYLPGKGVIVTTPKTDTSNRGETIPGPVMDLLKQWYDEQDPPSNIVFTYNRGPMLPDYLSTLFKRFADRIGLDIHLHSLRHTNASLLIAAGVDVRTVAGRLGHSQTSTTTNIYSHFLQSADERAAAALENLLKK